MAFNKVAIYGQHRSERITDTLQALVSFLQSQQCEIVIEEQTATNINDQNLPRVSYPDLGKDSDVVIVVGGDGSLLHAAHSVIQYDTPIIGINRGRLGFLTDILPQQLQQQLPDMLAGKFLEEKRFLLHTQIQHGKKQQDVSVALNDVVLLPGKFAHMISFDITINQQAVCEHRADGLIISTPTGSTAYSLSAGGPILHPGLDAIALVPMFSHNLSSRPVVVSGDSAIEIAIPEHNETAPCISCDGLERQSVKPGSVIHIKKHANKLRLLHPYDYNYYGTLRSKLGWETSSARN